MPKRGTCRHIADSLEKIRNANFENDAIPLLDINFRMGRAKAKEALRIIGYQNAKLYVEWFRGRNLNVNDVKTMIVAFQSRGIPVPTKHESNIPATDIRAIYDSMRDIFSSISHRNISPDTALRLASAVIYLYRGSL